MSLDHFQLFEKIGQELYGRQWRGDLAAALGIPDRTMRHWLAKGEIPAEWWPKVRDLCGQRSHRLRVAQMAAGKAIEGSRG